MQVVKGAIIGGLFSAIALGICSIVIVFVENTTGTLGLRGKDFWWLAGGIGFIFGLVTGSIEGATIGYFRTGFFGTILIGLLFLVAVFILLGLSTGGGLDENLRDMLIAAMTIQILNAIFVFLLTNRSNEIS